MHGPLSGAAAGDAGSDESECSPYPLGPHWRVIHMWLETNEKGPVKTISDAHCLYTLPRTLPTLHALSVFHTRLFAAVTHLRGCVCPHALFVCVLPGRGGICPSKCLLSSVQRCPALVNSTNFRQFSNTSIADTVLKRGDFWCLKGPSPPLRPTALVQSSQPTNHISEVQKRKEKKRK